MGISLAWVAVETPHVDDALARLGLARTGQRAEQLFHGISGHSLPHGWYLVAATPCDHRIATAASLAAVSAGCRVVACAVEEHVNFASTALWHGGVQVWQVEHEGAEDPENISHSGTPPAHFRELLASVEPGTSERLDGHFHMDIPLLLAKDLTGFLYNEQNPLIDSTPFEQLTDLAVQRRWWMPWK